MKWFSAVVLLALCSLAAGLGVSGAFAEESEGTVPPPRPTPAEMKAALTPAATAHADEVPTDPTVAQEMPHRDLDRSEALELMEGVFGSQLDTPAGMFDEFEPSRFLSDEVAVVAPEDLPEIPELTEGDYDGPLLLQSSAPLRTESSSGGEAPIDLALGHSEGELQPANPVVEVGIPQALGEGFELPELGIRISLEGAPAERAPSTVRDSVAAYPEVAEDTSLAVAPTTGGLETMALLQSADSPTSQTFDLELPSGASLERSPKGGGAEVVRDGEQILDVSAPTAIDATGTEVPVSFTVSGNSLTLEAEPGPDAAYPILVDPIFTGMAGAPPAGWTSYSTTPYYTVSDHATCTNAASPYTCGSGVGQGWAGAYIAGLPGPSIPAGNGAGWEYKIPRYAEEYTRIGKPPASYIVTASEEGLGFWHRADATPSPMFWTGIWAPVTGGWVSGDGFAGSYEWWGNAKLTYGAGQNTNGKVFAFSLSNMDGHGLGAMRDLHANYLNVWVADSEAPKWGTPPVMPWSKGEGEAPTIPFSVTDNGLGVYSIIAYYKGSYLFDSQIKNQSQYGQACGGNSFTCPYEWATPYWPSPKFGLGQLSQGISNVELQAEDPLGNKSAMMNAVFRIDRTAPVLGALSGTLTEQAKLGTTLPQYTLQASATDGSEASPQSGVVKTEIKVDGTVVPSLTKTQSCESKNCSMTPSWTLKASEFSAGAHEIVVVATDGVERKTSSAPLKVTFGPDTTKPGLTVTGALKEAPEGWVEQQSYTVPVTATDAGGYGVKQLKLLIDNKVVSQTGTTTCPAGGCSKSATFSVNTANYTGGAHEVEVQALDWATSSNTGVSKWTMNVNPKGAIPNGEATDTIEAMEETESETVVVMSTEEALSEAEREDGNDPGLIEEGGGLESVGTPTPVVIDQSGASVEIEGADGVVEVSPVGVAEGADPTVVNEVAAVSSDTFSSVDSTIRPKYNGVMDFQLIRGPTAPETYSWELSLVSGQSLESIDEEHAGVFFEGTEQLLISAEPAHDAIGKAVPTTISVSGKVITLTVHYKQPGVSYPVMSGASFEVGYEWKEAILPELPEEESVTVISKPPRVVNVPDPDEGEGASSSAAHKTKVAEKKMRKCQTYVCAVGFWEAWLEEAFLYNGTPHVYNGAQAWHDPKEEYSYHHCDNYSSTAPYSISVDQDHDCRWIGNHAHYSELGHYMCAQEVFHVSEHAQNNYHAMTFHNYGDGYAGPHQNSDCTVYFN